MVDDMAALNRSRCVTIPTTSPCSSTGRCRSCLAAIRSSTVRRLSLRSTTSMSFDMISRTCMPSSPYVMSLRIRCCGAVLHFPGAKPMPAAREHRGHLLYGLPCPRQPRLRLGAYVRLLTLCHRHETRCQAPLRLRHPSSVHVVDA